MLSRYLQALALLVGTIIGVGVFALPFLISRTGFLVGAAEIAALAAVVTLIHLMYGDIVVTTPERHRLPGYARYYLGPVWGRISAFSYLLELTGTLVIYILLGSVFLTTFVSLLFPAFSYPAAVGIFFFAGLLLFFFDSGLSTGVEGWLTFFLVLVMAIIFAAGVRLGTLEFLKTFDPRNIPLPYGAILFALTGTVVIPRTYEAFRGDHQRFRRLIIIGTAIPALLYLGFVFAVLSASPAGVSPEAIRGMTPVLGDSILILGGLVGFLATITSFIGVGLSYKGLLQFDFGFDGRWSWVLASVVPFIFVLIGVSDYIQVIGLIGAIAIGFANIGIVRIWLRLPRHELVSLFPRWLSWLLVGVFSAGILYQALQFIGVGIFVY